MHGIAPHVPATAVAKRALNLFHFKPSGGGAAECHLHSPPVLTTNDKARRCKVERRGVVVLDAADLARRISLASAPIKCIGYDKPEHSSTRWKIYVSLALEVTEMDRISGRR